MSKISIMEEAPNERMSKKIDLGGTPNVVNILLKIKKLESRTIIVRKNTRIYPLVR